nr:hypothetical protein [Tanacetum cinerariifolium]
MDNKKHIVNLESFREMLHICHRIPSQAFAELPFEEEIMDFIWFLGHSTTIRTLTDVNINKLYQPWRSFAAIINKCLTGKTSGYDSLRLSQAQILWGLYHKQNIDYAFLIWEYFVYQVKHKNHKKGDDFMFSTIKLAYKEYYDIATREATPKPKASARRTRGGSDTSITPPTTTATPRPTAAAPPGLTDAAKGKQTDKVPKAKSLSALSENSSDDEGANDQGKVGKDDEEDERDDGDEGEEKDDDEDKDGNERDGDDADQEVAKHDDKDDTEESRDDNKEGESDEEDDDEETRDEESFDPIPRTPKDGEDKSDDEQDQGLNFGGEGHVDEEEEDELYRDVNINQGRGIQVTQEVKDSHMTLTLVYPDGQQESSSVSSQFVTSMLNPTSDTGMESIFTTASSSVEPLPTPTPTMTPSIIATITTTSQAPIPPTTIPIDVIQNLLSFGSLFRFDDRLKSLEANFFEFRQINPFAKAVSAIPGIVYQYMNQQMNEAVRVAVQIQTDRLRDAYQIENDEFLRTIDENIKKIIKEQVKGQVKEQVSKILPRIEQSVNAQLEAEVLTRSSHSSRTSYVVAADLSEMERKKILIKKMEGNKSIQCSDEQRNLYKALVEAYKADKIILDTYGETVILKRRRDDDDDKDERPFAGSDRGSKIRREGKEPESASILSEPVTRSTSRSTTGSESQQMSASESAFVEEPVQTTSQMEEPLHPEFETGAEDQPIVQSFQHPEWFSQPQKPPTPDRDWNKTLPAVYESIQPVDTLILELLAGPLYELMKGSCKSLIEIEYHLEEVYKATTDQLDWFNPEGQQYPHNLLQPLPLIPDNRGRRVISFAHFINNDLEYLRGGASSRKYTTSVTKTKASDYGHIKWIEDLVPRTMWIHEPIDYDKHALWGRRIIAVAELKIVEWHSYKHLDWIMVRRDDDKLYKFKEGDFKRLRLQDIEDMLLLLIQGKLTNLIVEERFTFNVSLRMFTRSIVIQRRVKDLQLGVKSYQKRLNLTKPDTYRSDLKRKEAYTAYSNPPGFIYQNKDKKNRLMRMNFTNSAMGRSPTFVLL